MRKRIEELERRAVRLSDGAPPDAGCCTSYCCQDSPGTILAVGEIANLCEVDVEALGGLDIRVEVYGWVSFSANANGVLGAWTYVEVDGSTYVGAPRENLTVLSGDFMTLPIGITVDPATTAPIVRSHLQNVGGVALTVHQTYVKVHVGPQDGSPACGTIAGSGGPG
jgi:hypothetical protein